MKIKHIPIYLFIALTPAIISCDDFVSDVDVPLTKPKLVVNSYISPEDSEIKVIVQRSLPLYTEHPAYDQKFPVVSDATVILTQGENSITIPYYPYAGHYHSTTSEFPVEPGKTYYLEVSTPDGDKVTASCTVPFNLPPDIEITNIESRNEDGYSQKTVYFRFQDTPGAGDFYRSELMIRYGDGTPGNSYYTPMDLETGDRFVADANKDGEYFIYKTFGIGIIPNEKPSLLIHLSLTDKNYYSFHKSAYTDEDDNPFVEPTPVFSNIEGGLGVFGAFRGSLTEIELN
ncbi:MAG: DUF4249 domain-containing protein [Bacteroidales bacterium]|nr:DUF4249 domain-containing protein [Bacteroidales bacterium]